MSRTNKGMIVKNKNTPPKPKPRGGGVMSPSEYRDLLHGTPSADKLLDAIREHRATKTPATWTQADRRLYQYLPELNSQ